MSTSKTGKHGHAKVHMVGIHIFTGKKYEDICPSTHNMDVPNVARKDYQFIDIDEDDYIKVIDDDGTEFEFQVTDDNMKAEIKSKNDNGDEFLVTIMSACQQDYVCGTKNMGKNN